MYDGVAYCKGGCVLKLETSIGHWRERDDEEYCDGRRDPGEGQQ